MVNIIDSAIEEIKKYPVLGLVPIAGLFWLMLRTYPGGIAIVPTIESLHDKKERTKNELKRRRNCKRVE